MTRLKSYKRKKEKLQETMFFVLRNTYSFVSSTKILNVCHENANCNLYVAIAIAIYIEIVG